MTMKDLRNFDKDQLLELLGLEERPSSAAKLASALAFVGLGAIIGAGVSLFLTPFSGRELRESMGKKLRNGATRASDIAEQTLGESASGR